MQSLDATGFTGFNEDNLYDDTLAMIMGFDYDKWYVDGERAEFINYKEYNKERKKYILDSYNKEFNLIHSVYNNNYIVINNTSSDEGDEYV